MSVTEQIVNSIIGVTKGLVENLYTPLGKVIGLIVITGICVSAGFYYFWKKVKKRK